MTPIIYTPEGDTGLASAGVMTGNNRLVYVNITIPDFQVIATIRCSANPSFVMNSRPLATEIGQGHQVSSTTFLALRKTTLFHEVHLPNLNSGFQYTLPHRG